MQTILVVDDDAHIRELLRFYLQREGYQVIQAEDGKDALDILIETDIHLAIVDIMMPRIDGYALCKEIREDYDIPVLMLTAKGELQDKEKAFDAGSDDYVVKPYEPKEIVFRIKALLRRFIKTDDEIIHVGALSIHRRSYEVTAEGITFVLPLKEFEILSQLASFPNRIFTMEQLLELVWGNQYEGNDRTVDVDIKLLREHFCQTDYGIEIETVRGVGYKLVT